jgi:TIR domain-containing protein
VANKSRQKKGLTLDMGGPRVFISYSHEDEAWKDKLLKHLKVFEREGLLEIWEDRSIDAGTEWLTAIMGAIASAKVAVLLISADFLNSDFIREKELPILLERRASHGLLIFPIIMRDCPWEEVRWLEPLQVRPPDGIAIENRRNWQTLLKKIAREILDAVRKADGSSISPPLANTNEYGAADESSPGSDLAEAAVLTDVPTPANIPQPRDSQSASAEPARKQRPAPQALGFWLIAATVLIVGFLLLLPFRREMSLFWRGVSLKLACLAGRSDPTVRPGNLVVERNTAGYHDLLWAGGVINVRAGEEVLLTALPGIVDVHCEWRSGSGTILERNCSTVYTAPSDRERDVLILRLQSPCETSELYVGEPIRIIPQGNE